MNKEKDCITEAKNFNQTGFNYTMSLISGKYKLSILYAIYRHKIIRFNQLQRYLNIISHKSLGRALKELEKDKFIIRNEYIQNTPKVEYSLSERGATFIPILYALCDWGERQYKKGTK